MVDAAEAPMRFKTHDDHHTYTRRKRAPSGRPASGTGTRPKRAAKDKPKQPEAMDDDDDMCVEGLQMQTGEEAAEKQANGGGGATKSKTAARATARRTAHDTSGQQGVSRFVGDPVPDAEARRRWPERYGSKVRTNGMAVSTYMI